MKARLLLLFFLFGAYSVSSFALTVSGLYQTTVPVANESVTVRVEALRQAMQQVLIKLSGNSDIASDLGAAHIINNAEQYVQQFRYSQPQTGTAETSILELQVRFDETALNNEIRNYALTLWGKERPAVLVWLAIDSQDGGRRLTGLEESPDLVKAIEHTASARGIPLLFPLLDLQDTSQLGVSDVWGSFRQPVMEASARYQSDAILAGRITQNPGGLWETQWSFFDEQQTLEWSSEGNEMELVLAEAINELADTLASRYATFDSSGAELIQVQVSNVRDFDDYAAVLSYLESLQSITEVMVKNVNDDEVKFEVISHGGITAINQAVQLGKVLQLSGNELQASYRYRNNY